jgi:hypothetical protein
VGSDHGGGRGTHNKKLRPMLEGKERRGRRAQEDGGEMVAIEKVTRVLD